MKNVKILTIAIASALLATGGTQAEAAKKSKSAGGTTLSALGGTSKGGKKARLQTEEEPLTEEFSELDSTLELDALDSPQFELEGGESSLMAPLYSSVLQWCNDSLYPLAIAEEEALMLQFDEDFKGAAARLIRGLQEAKQITLHVPRGMGRLAGPLMRRAIYRGLEMARVLQKQVASSANGAQSVYWFLMGHYDFIRNTAHPLDVETFIPFYYSGPSWNDRYCGGSGCPERCSPYNWSSCGGGAFEAMQEIRDRLVDYARAELESVQNSLTGESRRTGEVVPMVSWNGHDFLRMMQMAARYASQDLSSAWPAGYACEIGQLRRLSGRIGQYLGNGSSYWSDRSAINRVHGEVSELVSNIGSGCY